MRRIHFASEVLEQLVLRHLARVGPVNSAEDVIGIEG